MRKLKKSVIRIGGVGLFASSALGLSLFHHYDLSLTLQGDSPYHLQTGETFVDPGASASMNSNFFPFLNRDVPVAVNGVLNCDENGIYTLTYTASHGKTTLNQKRDIIVKDYIPPEITLETTEDSYTPYNHAYTEEGYSAYDEMDGDLSDRVQVTVYENYVLYTVKDSQENYTTVSRRIHYDDRQAPQITFHDGGGYDDIRIYVGEAYTPNYEAIDDSEDDVTDRVQVEGSVDTNTIGDYPITYTVSDSYGHTTNVTRTVHVAARPVNVSGYEDNKTIYLTFDDGPAAPTQFLLDVLDRYNVKATFFTTSTHGYAYMIGEEERRGHTVALHTFTHNYAAVYTSTEAYWNDFNAQNEVILSQTGHYANLFRFPGGSSNTVSASYCTGIMSTLVQQASDRGYQYFDWNVSSGDGGSLEDTEQIYNNIISGIQQASANGRPSIVLQHDTKQSSMDAVERVIQWALDNGYHFERLSSNSYPSHHGINN